MRRLLLLVPMMLACAKADSPSADSAADSPQMTAMLTDADVSGTWQGMTMPAVGDSVLARWTQTCANGTCKGVMEGMVDTMVSTYVIDGDSVMGSSAAMMDPMLKVEVTDHWTLHLRDGKVIGTGMNRLASKPDSVVFAYRFEGSRAP